MSALFRQTPTNTEADLDGGRECYGIMLWNNVMIVLLLKYIKIAPKQ